MKAKNITFCDSVLWITDEDKEEIMPFCLRGDVSSESWTEYGNHLVEHDLSEATLEILRAGAWHLLGADDPAYEFIVDELHSGSELAVRFECYLASKPS